MADYEFEALRARDDQGRLFELQFPPLSARGLWGWLLRLVADRALVAGVRFAEHVLDLVEQHGLPAVRRALAEYRKKVLGRGDG